MHEERQGKMVTNTSEEKKMLKKTTVLVSIFLAGQYAVGLAAKAFDISMNHNMGLSWVGIVLGWGSLFCGFSFRKRLNEFRSKLFGNLYLVAGIVLLFVGGIIGGWILALGHQLFGFYFYKSTRFVLLQWLIWFVGYLLLGFLFGIALSAAGINVFAQ